MQYTYRVRVYGVYSYFKVRVYQLECIMLPLAIVRVYGYLELECTVT